MKKHRLLFLWLSLLLCAVGARADDITINDGEATNNRVPIYGLWTDSYTRTQFIIPADDLTEMVDGTIEQMTFYSSSEAIDWGAAEFEVYITEVDYTSFASTELVYWENMDKVKNAGTLSVSGNQMEVILDAPYKYGGGNLVIGFYQTVTGSYKGVSWYGVTQETTTALGGYNSTIAEQKFLPKTTFIFTPAGASTCPKPSGLAISDITNEGATLTWNAVEGTSYNLNILSESSEENITDVTSPYTFTGLEAGTTYVVKVQTVCSASDLSAWSSPKSFTTEICSEEDKCLISYSLTDSYGDGWNNAKISVVDDATGISIATLTLTSGQSSEGSFSVCPGREISFIWTPGSYPGECSFVILDVNEDEILNVAAGEAPTSSGVLKSITSDCTMATCATPKNLAADDVAAFSATLSWTPGAEDQNAWEIVYSTEEDFDPDSATPVTADSNPFELTGLEPETTYYAYVRAVCSSDDHSKWSNKLSFTTIEACVTPTDVEATDVTANSATISWEGNADNYEIRYTVGTGKWLQYDNGADYYTGIGTGSAGTFTWAVMYPGSMVSIDKLSKISIYEASSNTADITVKIYSGGDEAPGTLLYTETVTPLVNGWHDITLASTVSVTPGENLWIELTEAGTYNISACACTESNNQWMLYDGTWYHVGDLAASLAGYGWMIRGYLGEPLDPETATWITGSCTDNSYPLDGLDPETDYVFQVRAKCDEESYSRWAETNFTTAAADATPEIEITELAATTATVDWTDTGSNPTSWDLWYRLLGESFESGALPDGWTTIDADGDGYNWQVSQARSHSGSYCVQSASYDNGTNTALTPDNWLISPEVTLGGSMTFWVRGQDPNYPAEHFAVFLSQDGNDDPSKFTQIYPATGEEIATGEYVQHTVDLSKYKGTGYLAIRHFNVTDQFILNIDDIQILESGQEADWIEMNGLTSHPVTIEGLDPTTAYEVQVRTHFASGDISDWASTSFTTAPLSITLLDQDYDDGNSNTAMLQSYEGMTTDVVISGRNFLKNGNWNTLCLPFNVDDIEASPLAGATIKELTAATIKGTVLYLTYTNVTSIEANKSYIIKWESGENADMTFEGVTLEPLDYDYFTMEIGTDILSFGLYTELSLTASEQILYLGADNKMYYPSTSGFHVGAFRTLIRVPADAGVNDTMFEIDGTATSIEEVNGLEIVSNKWFTIDGRQLPKQPTQKGIYINNGRKVVVK